MINLEVLARCIEVYTHLEALEGITPQVRGQKLNILIGDVLSAHHIYAKPNQRSKGEIDVCFRVRDKRFIMEAKWESTPINIDPIAKLGLRINQRIPNNMGVMLSMSGYTRDVLRQMDQAGRPQVLLIDREVFRAMLYGTIEAELLFDACLDVAAFDGKYHLTLSDIFKYIPTKPLEFAINESTYVEVNHELFQGLIPQGNISEFKVVKADLPFGQNGISMSGSTAYVTLSDGIYKFDGMRFIKIHAIDNPQNRCIYNEQDHRICFVQKGSAFAISESGSLSILTKRYPGHVRLFRSDSQINLISNGSDFTDPIQPVRLVRDITGRVTETICDYPASCAVDACIINSDKYALIGSAGLRMYSQQQQQWHLDVVNGASVSFFEGSLFFLENGVRLKSIDMDGSNLKTLADFNLQGSVGDFALLNTREFFFHLCYPDGKTSKTCVTYLRLQ